MILCSSVKICYGQDAGITLTNSAFNQVCGKWAGVVIAGCLCLFAFATVLGWGLYGMQCAVFLFGGKAMGMFVWLQAIMVVISAAMPTDTLWLFAETVNGLMAIPNLIVLAKLTPQLLNMIKCHLQMQMASDQSVSKTVLVV